MISELAAGIASRQAARSVSAAKQSAQRPAMPRPLPILSRNPTTAFLKPLRDHSEGAPPQSHRLYNGERRSVELSGKVHGAGHRVEFALETVLRTFGQLLRLDPKIGRQGHRVFADEFYPIRQTSCQVPPQPPEKSSAIANYCAGAMRAYFNRLPRVSTKKSGALDGREQNATE